MSAYFIAAVGTGVGKTFTSCALLHAARQQGRAVGGFKPIISGWDAGDNQSDTALILRASGTGDAVDVISPWRLAAPLSPHRAATLEGKHIDVDALVDWTRRTVAAAQPAALTLVETVGGVMVPLTDDATTLDWMAAVNLPVIVVTGSYLGAISHTLTALSVLRARSLAVAALVMNESDGSSVTLAEAEAGLAPFVADIPWRVTQPRVSSWEAATAIARLVEKL